MSHSKSKPKLRVYLFIQEIVLIVFLTTVSNSYALPSPLNSKSGRHLYEISNTTDTGKTQSKFQAEPVDQSLDNSGEIVSSSSGAYVRQSQSDLLHSASKISINKCTEDVFTEDYWTVPKWLKGPESDIKRKQLNENEFFNGELFKFRIRTRPVQCGEASFRVYKVIKSEIFRNDSYDIDWQYGGYADYFTPFGEFKMNEYFLDHQSYCVSTFFGDEITLEVCIPQIKIRKCCPYGTVVKFSLSSAHEIPNCIEILGKDWAPFYYKDGDHDADGIWNDMDVSYFSEFYNPDCYVYDKLTPNRGANAPYLSDIRVLEDGTVLTRPSGNHMWDHPKIYEENYIEEFCIDGFLDSDQMNKTEGPVDFVRSPQNQIVLFCHQSRHEITAEEEDDIIYSWIYFFLFSFSSFVLGLITLIYALIWKRQSIHGWTILGFSGCMCLWFLFSAVAHGAGLFQGYSWSLHVGGTTCILNGILWHFFYVASFSWMAVLNYDLWSATCSQNSPAARRGRNLGKKFGLYLCAGFGPPILVVTIGLSIEHSFDVFDDRVVRPLYGYDICCVDKTALLYYASSVSFIFFGLNLFFAWSTMVFLCKYKKTMQHDSAVKDDVSQFGKLFTLMGFTWIFEMASWNEELTWYLAVFDVYNIIQAVGLFWIFVYRREVLEQLGEEYPVIKDYLTCLRPPKGAEKFDDAEDLSQNYSPEFQGISTITVTSVTNFSACFDMEEPLPKSKPKSKPRTHSNHKDHLEIKGVEFELTTRS